MNLDIVKRAFHYIIHGIPIKNIQINVVTNIKGDILKNKNIIITGGSKGIGYAISKKCISEGANILICGRNIDDLLVAQKELGEKCRILQFDVSNVNKIPEFYTKAKEIFNDRIDCLVNNAGISFHEKGIEYVTEKGFDQQFSVNFKGAYFMAKYYIETIKNRNSNYEGNILFITSERGSFCTDIPYGLSKATINSLVGALSTKYYLKYKIRINGIAPGVTVSEMTGRKREDNMVYTGSPLGRVLIPEEISEVASFLISDNSSCITGEIVHCDGGAHLKCI